jgi:hypothetical protein
MNCQEKAYTIFKRAYDIFWGEWEWLARYRLNLSQGAAAHFIDGARGNFRGKSVSFPPGGWSSEDGECACDSDNMYTK